ncbi:hypothetical protein GGX14DRAFT_404055 [Mycena pura]|uniref:Uncharacterized protein n=1 Tax=Mycena pura TaxID=153505 RepID=A0AAD6Y5Q1_9AGAR|nr:hypothetical protein GGX14DRAFT_404055 [Mycena pura]
MTPRRVVLLHGSMGMPRDPGRRTAPLSEQTSPTSIQMPTHQQNYKSVFRGFKQLYKAQKPKSCQVNTPLESYVRQLYKSESGSGARRRAMAAGTGEKAYLGGCMQGRRRSGRVEAHAAGSCHSWSNGISSTSTLGKVAATGTQHQCEYDRIPENMGQRIATNNNGRPNVASIWDDEWRPRRALPCEREWQWVTGGKEGWKRLRDDGPLEMHDMERRGICTSLSSRQKGRSITEVQEGGKHVPGITLMMRTEVVIRHVERRHKAHLGQQACHGSGEIPRHVPAHTLHLLNDESAEQPAPAPAPALAHSDNEHQPKPTPAAKTPPAEHVRQSLLRQAAAPPLAMAQPKKVLRTCHSVTLGGDMHHHKERARAAQSCLMPNKELEEGVPGRAEGNGKCRGDDGEEREEVFGFVFKDWIVRFEAKPSSLSKSEKARKAKSDQVAKPRKAAS